MKPSVVDTNVAVVANGRQTHASEQCQLECVQRLRDLVRHGLVVLDRMGLIMKEYRQNLQASGQPGVGDAFFRHVFDHQYDPTKCELVEIAEIPDDARDFDQFPRDQALIGFDPSDRKFVAAARASEHDPVILNATDSGWARFEEALARHGMRIEQLCPGDIGDG